MTAAPECTGQINIATISTSYGQMCGVLAGFAFTALVVLMTPSSTAERPRHDKALRSVVLLTLLSAFISLVIATLTYSVLGGENMMEAKNRAATAELIDGIPFGLAAIMLFHGVALLMESMRLEKVAIWAARAVAAVVAPTLAFSYLMIGTQDSVAAREGNTRAACMTTHLPGHGFLLAAALPIILIVALIPRFQPARWRRWALAGQTAPPIAAMVASVAAAVTSSGVESRDHDFLMSPFVLNIYVPGIFTLFLLFGLSMAAGFPDDRARDPVEPVRESEPITHPPRCYLGWQRRGIVRIAGSRRGGDASAASTSEHAGCPCVGSLLPRQQREHP